MPAKLSSAVRHGAATLDPPDLRRESSRRRRRERSQPGRRTAHVDGVSTPRAGSAAGDVGRRVEHVVATMLAGGRGSPDIRLVADAIGTSVRTLQRRLQATGLTFGGAVDRARCAAARRMLKDPRRRIGDVARTLGYSDHAHFTRAFQRWMGVTPRDYRCRDRTP